MQRLNRLTKKQSLSKDKADVPPSSGQAGKVEADMF